MEKIIEFIANNYVWFLTITILLLFALIGYIYDTKKNDKDLLKKSEEELDEESLEKIKIPEDKSLSDMVSKSKNINPETKSVEVPIEEEKTEENTTQNDEENTYEK